MVLGTLGTRPRAGRGRVRRRTREVQAGAEPSPVTVARATVIEVAEPFADEGRARSWLDGGQEAAQAHATDALAVLNGVLRAHRAAAADPHAHEAGPEQALIARLGFGEGEQVAEGRWASAIELDLRPPRPRRVAALRPQERLAALLSGRDRTLACEELVLRARSDVDAGRAREAALQVRVALEAALAELDPGIQGMPERLEELGERRNEIAAAANAALQGEPDPEAAAAVEAAVDRIEAALRARTAPGI